MSESSLFSDPKVIAAIFGGISAIIVSLLNNVLNGRRQRAETKKMQAETDKLKAETDKLKAETDKLKVETDNVKADAISLSRVEAISLLIENEENLKNLANYESSLGDEIELFSSEKIDGFDIKFNQGYCYANNSAYGKRAQGDFNIKDNIINVERFNGDGRLEIELRKYTYNGEKGTFIPKNQQMSGDRKLHLQLRIKSNKGRQLIRSVVKDENENKWLGQKTTYIDENNDWVTIEAFFRIPPDKDTFIRIDNEEPTDFSTSFQIKDIKLTERK